MIHFTFTVRALIAGVIGAFTLIAAHAGRPATDDLNRRRRRTYVQGGGPGTSAMALATS